MKDTQKVRVMQYMEHFGSITSLDAFRDLGITRLAAVIFLLKKDGVQIAMEMCEASNRFGETTRFARYSLVKEENA